MISRQAAKAAEVGGTGPCGSFAAGPAMIEMMTGWLMVVSRVRARGGALGELYGIP